MASKSAKSRKGQSIVELALFGSLLLMVFGALLTYIQRYNDQQYVQMEAFRRALEKANTYQGNDTEGAGASVQYTLTQNRRYIDLSGGYMKGASQGLSSSANVYWAVPKIGSASENIIVMRVNEDENTIDSKKYNDFINTAVNNTGAAAASLSFQTEVPSTSSVTEFSEVATKTEKGNLITNKKESTLSEDITTSVPFSVRYKDSDEIAYNGTYWNTTQHLYYDTRDGQYKYSEKAPATGVTRSRIWETRY
ncbi:MAG: hypothetical protein WC628_00760 [Candidatus Omnitrophota bacterium]